MTAPRSQRRQAVERYRAAREAFDDYTERHEQARKAGQPVPTSEDEDPEYQRLNSEFADAAAAAPWWARMLWS